jgi:hypothetical protein
VHGGHIALRLVAQSSRQQCDLEIGVFILKVALLSLRSRCHAHGEHVASML